MRNNRLVFVDVTVDGSGMSITMSGAGRDGRSMWLNKTGRDLMMRGLSVLLENESGALSRVIVSFRNADASRENLTVWQQTDPTRYIQRMTIQTVGDEKVLEQIENCTESWLMCCASAASGTGAH